MQTWLRVPSGFINATHVVSIVNIGRGQGPDDIQHVLRLSDGKDVPIRNDYWPAVSKALGLPDEL